MTQKEKERIKCDNCRLIVLENLIRKCPKCGRMLCQNCFPRNEKVCYLCKIER